MKSWEKNPHKEYLLQLTAQTQIKSHLCRIAAGVAMNVITTQSNLIWSTGRHLWPKWFPGLQTLMLPRVNEISRGFHASFHKALTWSMWTGRRLSSPIKRMHSTCNGMRRSSVMAGDLEWFMQCVVLHVIFYGDYDAVLKMQYLC